MDHPYLPYRHFRAVSCTMKSLFPCLGERTTGFIPENVSILSIRGRDRHGWFCKYWIFNMLQGCMWLSCYYADRIDTFGAVLCSGFWNGYLLFCNQLTSSHIRFPRAVNGEHVEFVSNWSSVLYCLWFWRIIFQAPAPYRAIRRVCTPNLAMKGHAETSDEGRDADAKKAESISSDPP